MEAPAPDAPVPDSPPQRPTEPLLGRGSPASWLSWLRHLSRAARRRLAGASLLLVAALALAVFNLWLFGEVADEVVERETAGLDDAVYAFLQRFASPTVDRAAAVFSWAGAELVAILLVVVLIVLARRGRWGAAAGLLLVTAGAQLLNNVLKELFHRTRPNPTAFLIPAQAFSFPSGHAMVSAAFYAYLAYLGWRLIRHPGWRLAWVLTLGALVLLIGLSRVYLGVHYITDVVAGYAAGLLWAEAVVLAGRFLPRPRRRVALAAVAPTDAAGTA